MRTARWRGEQQQVRLFCCRNAGYAMRRAILVTLDGLRRDLISAETIPNLVAFAKCAESFADYRTVFPSCTRVVSASIATGCYPARHELQGNSLVLMENGVLVPHDAGHPDFLQHKR
jgi:predicted AlkP superfamily pyrophosphatase or phosphodiesterase